MPIYIKDPEVDVLVDHYLAVSGARNKTEAVKNALLNGIAAFEQAESLTARIAKVQRRAAELGLKPDAADDKFLMDDLSGGI